jgi:hypothetical protein
MGAAAASTHCFTHRLVGPKQHTHSASLLPIPGKIFQSLFKIMGTIETNLKNFIGTKKSVEI